jgi:hypothetical protein
MALKEKIIKKFGSVSGFARAVKLDVNDVHRTLRIVEELKSKKTMPVRSAYKNLQDLYDVTKAPKATKTTPIRTLDREMIKDYFINKKILVKDFAVKHDISKSFIYSVINGSATEESKTFLKLKGIISKSH